MDSEFSPGRTNSGKQMSRVMEVVKEEMKLKTRYDGTG